MRLPVSVKTAAHWAEHPNTIRWVQNRFMLPVGAAGMAALGVADAWKAQPEDRKKVIIRDALVLGATAAGTLAAARGIGVGSFKGLMNYDHGEGIKKLLKEKVEPAIKNLEKWGYSKALTQKLDVFKADQKDLSKIKNQKQSLQELFDGMRSELKKKLGENNPDLEKTWRKHMDELFPEGEPEGFVEEAKKAASFFAVGGISVLSGLAGGLAANKVNNVKDSDATVNMIKEGIFQFVANIALCAVGAGVALGVVNGEWGPRMGGKNFVRKWGDQFSQKITKSPANKLIRTGIIGAGLSVGIFGGSQFANVLGRKYINPFFDKMQGKAPQPQEQNSHAARPTFGRSDLQQAPQPQEKRKIEFWDWILHLDDVPTAMALAGVEIIEPIIPLFFAFSGYRTGIGYRNDEASKNKGTEKQAKQQNEGIEKSQSSQGFGFAPASQSFGRMNDTPAQDVSQTFGQKPPQPFQWAYPAQSVQYR